MDKVGTAQRAPSDVPANPAAPARIKEPPTCTPTRMWVHLQKGTHPQRTLRMRRFNEKVRSGCKFLEVHCVSTWTYIDDRLLYVVHFPQK